jgi:hypothetical protein
MIFVGRLIGAALRMVARLTNVAKELSVFGLRYFATINVERRQLQFLLDISVKELAGRDKHHIGGGI